ncbi:MAG: tRNA uridine(34) 5-carboxymethylaminomethyl modification radical SAM/GNAT enzyme Elp3, partial [Nanoarchaeota archaeon]
MNFYQQILTEIKRKKISTQKALNEVKRDLAKNYRLKTIPTNIEILLSLPKNKIKQFKTILITKPTRTISGVAPLAIMTKPFPCPHAQSGGPCIMCPGGPNSEFGEVPQSYTGKEPATMRGIRNNYDAYLQIFNRLEQYVLLGQNCEKAEVILMGGTFPSYPVEYQEEFVKFAFKALNDFSELFYDQKNKTGFNYLKFKEFFELPAQDLHDQERIKRIHERLFKLKNKTKTTLKTEQTRNEIAKIRCVALCIETRPDYGFLEQGNQMLKLGCTRVELGIQSVYDDVLKKIKRGHTAADTKKSIRILKDLGFKVAGHYMPGLPGVDYNRDLQGMKSLFEDADYKPDMLKLYPCMVVKGTQLYKEYKKGKFKPLTAEEAAKLIVEFKKFIPEYCRVQRVQRDIPTYQIEAGVEMTNLRQYMHNKFTVTCRCIRCREPKGGKINWKKAEIKVNEYAASEGTEFFISAEADDTLIGFCRLRFPAESLRKEITAKSALIRELHVYGTATALGEEGAVQHHGWGKKLMQKAEELAVAAGKNKTVVISGIGAKEYYRKLGYKKEGVYMV